MNSGARVHSFKPEDLAEMQKGLLRTVAISEQDFKRMAEFIEAELGIKMPYSKKALLESRLQKRLRLLGIGSFREYTEYLFSPSGVENELIHMIDLVTTNKTDFFRESEHFDYLAGTALPELTRAGAGVKRPLTVWSAGCSSGEEPYTMSMVLSEYAENNPGLGFDYAIFATDISTRMLQAASKGIYKEERLAPVPMALRRKYFLKSKDESKGLVRLIPELRSKIRFSRLNFMIDEFGFSDIDIIFCRNVIIYFDKDTQARLFAKFCDCMRPGSYLFIGHSETLSGFDIPLEKIAPAIYRKDAGRTLRSALRRP